MPLLLSSIYIFFSPYLLQRELNEDVQRLQGQLQHKEQTINDLQSTVERLQAAQQSPTDAQSLIASIESDKVAASRAVAQNVELKQQLDEIQLAFIQIVSGAI